MLPATRSETEIRFVDVTW